MVHASATKNLESMPMATIAADPGQAEASLNQSLRYPELEGRRALVLLFSHYPGDARPRRAAEALVKAGMTVELVCLREAEHEPIRETINGLEIYRLSMQRQRGGKLAYVWQYGSFLLRTFLIASGRAFRRRYDIVHVHNMPDVLVFSALLPKLFGARVILDLHDPMPELMMTIFGLREKSALVRCLRWLEKLSIWFSDRVITVNRACQRIFGGRSCAPSKIEVVMNSPDEKIFHLRPVPVRNTDGERPFVMMYHGSIVERHGLDLAVHALKKVRQAIPNARLKVCGRRNAFLDKVSEEVRAAGLEDAVEFLGPKTHEQIAEEIDRSDVGIIPNRKSIFTELNTPTRIFEYLSRGKPVIAPAAPGIQDYFTKEQLFFFELGNAEDLANQIEHVYSNPEEAHQMVLAGQDVYRQHLWNCERARFVGAVANLVKRRP